MSDEDAIEITPASSQGAKGQCYVFRGSEMTLKVYADTPAEAIDHLAAHLEDVLPTTILKGGA